MKKTVVAILVLAMLVVFTGCGGSKPEQPVSSGEAGSGKSESQTTAKQQTEPEYSYLPDGTEKMVSITDFMNQMMCDKGKWECPAQYNDYGLEFSSFYGRNLVCMSKENADSKSTDYLIAEIGSVTYNDAQKMYRVTLLQYDKPLEYEELHIDVSAIGEGFVHAENIYHDFSMVEYVFLADAGDFINGYIGASGNFPTPEYNTESGIIGVESETWILRDENLMDAYKPLISLDSAGYFSFKENLYDGMGHYYGVYTDTGNTVECLVYSIDFSGYAGDEVYYISFEKTSPTTLTLKTDLCYSCSGAIFDLQ